MTTDPTEGPTDRPTPEMRADAARWHAERESRKVTAEDLEAWLSSDAAQAEDSVNRADKVRAHDPACDTLEWLWLPGRAKADQGEPGACADCGLVFQDDELVVLGAEKYDPAKAWRCLCCMRAYVRTRRAPTRPRERRKPVRATAAQGPQSGDTERLDMAIGQDLLKTKHMQFTGLDSCFRIIEWMKACGDTCALADEVQYDTPIMIIYTATGAAAANPGDWIVRGKHGDFRVSAGSDAPVVAGARLEVGPWLQRFTIHGPIACTADGCDGWAGELPLGSDALDLWHIAQHHMLEAHLGDDATVVPPEFFNQPAACHAGEESAVS